MLEKWADVVGYEGLYLVSESGEIKGVKSNKILKTYPTYNGYPRVKLYKNARGKTLMVHRIVAETFLPNPNKKPQVNHINGIKTDNNVLNLEWATQTENLKHAVKNNLLDPSKAWKSHQRKVIQKSLDGNVLKVWNSITEAAKCLNVQISNIHHCCTNKIKSTGGYIWNFEN